MPASPVRLDSRGSSDAFFLVMRRIRIPLVVLVVIFSVSVLGLTLVPGGTSDEPWHMGFFDAFYFMSYTATTIGYGELPQAFNDAQRMWVTFSIYLTVIGWAYALGTLFAVLQDRAFKQALAAQRFRRRVQRIREPFWLVAGHGQTGELLGRWLDGLGIRFTVLDLQPERIDVLDLGAYQQDVPAWCADAREPDVLKAAGLLSPHCAGVLALTDDDEANLAVTMSACALNPALQVVARASSAAIAERMRAFGSPVVVDPFDRFGDHFGIAMRAPAAEQLSDWLTRAPGTPLPERLPRLGLGPWIVCGYGRFGRELTRDLRRDGFHVTVVDTDRDAAELAVTDDGVRVVTRDSTDPEALGLAGIDDALGFVAATDNDITNLSLVTAARRRNPSVFVVARQNQPVNADLFDALHVDLLMVPSRVVAREALAHVAATLLWQFLQQASHQGQEWSEALVDRLVERVGEGAPDLWQLALTPDEAPAVARRMPLGDVRLGDLLRDPSDRDVPLEAVALLLVRGGETTAAPGDDVLLAPGDTLLLAGRPRARRAMETTLEVDESAAYVLADQRVASGWLWRRLTRT